MKDPIAIEIHRLAKERDFNSWFVIEGDQRRWFLQIPDARAIHESCRSLTDEEAFVMLYRRYLSKKARSRIPEDFEKKSDIYKRLFGHKKDSR